MTLMAPETTSEMRWPAVATGGWTQHEVDTSARRLFSAWYVKLSESFGTGGTTVDIRHYLQRIPASRAGSQVSIFVSPDDVSDSVIEQSTSERVNLIRETFRLSVTDLAAVLAVERPTIYSWLKDASTPSTANEKRLQSISALASVWIRSASSERGPAMKAQTNFGGTLLDTLKWPDLPQSRIREHLSMEALTTKRDSARDFARLARVAAIPPRPDSDFDVATGRPLGPEA